MRGPFKLLFSLMLAACLLFAGTSALTEGAEPGAPVQQADEAPAERPEDTLTEIPEEEYNIEILPEAMEGSLPPVVFTAQPQDQLDVPDGQVVVFSIDGNNIAACQWYFSADGGQSYSPVEGATAGSFGFTAVPELHNFLFYCQVVGVDGNVYCSDAGRLALNEASLTPSAAIATELTTPKSGKAVYKMTWSLPAEAEVKSIIIYRGTKSNSTPVAQATMESKGTTFNTKETRTSGEYIFTIRNLTPSKYQNVMTIATYSIGDKEYASKTNVICIQADGQETSVAYGSEVTTLQTAP